MDELLKDQIRSVVRKQYADLTKARRDGESQNCGTGCCVDCENDSTLIGYSENEFEVAQGIDELTLGCGNPQGAC